MCSWYSRCRLSLQRDSRLPGNRNQSSSPGPPRTSPTGLLSPALNRTLFSAFSNSLILEINVHYVKNNTTQPSLLVLRTVRDLGCCQSVGTCKAPMGIGQGGFCGHIWIVTGDRWLCLCVVGSSPPHVLLNLPVPLLPRSR